MVAQEPSDEVIPTQMRLLSTSKMLLVGFIEPMVITVVGAMSKVGVIELLGVRILVEQELMDLPEALNCILMSLIHGSGKPRCGCLLVNSPHEGS